MGDRLLTGKPFRYVTSQLGQLSLSSLRGRLIEYQPARLGWRRGGHLCRMADNTVWSQWQVASRTWISRRSIRSFTFMWPIGESGVKLQYKLAHTRSAVNIARMRDDPTSVIGRYDILHFCRQLLLVAVAIFRWPAMGALFYSPVDFTDASDLSTLMQVWCIGEINRWIKQRTLCARILFGVGL